MPESSVPSPGARWWDLLPVCAPESHSEVQYGSLNVGFHDVNSGDLDPPGILTAYRACSFVTPVPVDAVKVGVNCIDCTIDARNAESLVIDPKSRLIDTEILVGDSTSVLLRGGVHEGLAIRGAPATVEAWRSLIVKDLIADEVALNTRLVSLNDASPEVHLSFDASCSPLVHIEDAGNIVLQLDFGGGGVILTDIHQERTARIIEAALEGQNANVVVANKDTVSSSQALNWAKALGRYPAGHRLHIHSSNLNALKFLSDSSNHTEWTEADFELALIMCPNPV